jgi:hypothetical protein
MKILTIRMIQVKTNVISMERATEKKQCELKKELTRPHLTTREVPFPYTDINGV